MLVDGGFVGGGFKFTRAVLVDDSCELEIHDLDGTNLLQCGADLVPECSSPSSMLLLNDQSYVFIPADLLGPRGHADRYA